MNVVGWSRHSVALWGTRLLTLLPYDRSRTILLTGSPRSGTTWVANLLQTIPGSSILFEPFQLDHVPQAREAQCTWRTYVHPEDDWTAGDDFVARVLDGRVLNRWTTQEIRRPKPTTTWIVKAVRANRLLPWICSRFEIRPPVLLLRHPCAVVASQLERGWTEAPPDPGTADHRLLAAFPDLEAVLARVRTPEEALAATWALDALVPLRHPGPWQVVCFEHLVTRGEAGLRPLLDRWGVPAPAGLAERLGEWSRTAASRDRSRVVAGWRDQLEPDQVRRILETVWALGVDLYGESPEPDEARLDAWSS